MRYLASPILQDLKSTGQISKEGALVIAGPLGWLYADIFKFHKVSAHKESIHLIGPVKEEEKGALYSLAKIFVYPSIYEGFGLPPLEAMACGTPVISSTSSSLVESVGNAGILIDPYNVSDLTDAISGLLADPTLCQTFIERGKERVQQFRWNAAAKSVLKLIHSLTV